ncbi:MAG: AAC(3) family N-acetyltransferase [Candidatus Krumholzibacteria bacterium]|nr:AAC(3) family N-acetyltransferase [Candidatus Krumholzibacteria bacterium]
MTTRTIDRSPHTESSLRRDLVTIGVEPGMTLVVHSSLSAIGWVVGGAPSVVRVLLDVVGDRGTLAMPAATPHCSDPAQWTDPRVEKAWLSEVRENLPLFDPQTTPTAMGAIPETFRTWPGTTRSHHPLESVCARGPSALDVTQEHPLAFSEGPGTPFAKLHELDSWVLLIGVGFNRCTALHFAESLVKQRRTTTVRFASVENGRRVWVEVPNVADDNDTHFPIIGKKYTSAGRARQGLIGEARSMMFPMRDLVSFAVAYFESVL